ncbi:MAG TPA: M28 family peptidase [Gemmatimonadaceae bacterium]|nr:M28 family peptidase [Gemmatimonadaceae bacterium]
MNIRFVIRAASAGLLVAPMAAFAQGQTCPATTPGATMPLTYKGGPTAPAISACDLMTRLYIYAADSMRGREAGSPDAIRATAYIESEVRRLGLEPAGDKGSYFQYLPVTARSLDPASTIVSGSTTFHADKEFTTATADRSASGEVVFAIAGDTAGDFAGKIVIVRAAPGGGRGGRGGGGGGGGRGFGGGGAQPFAGAAAVITIVDRITPSRPSYQMADTVNNEGRAAYARAHPDTTANGRGGRGGAGGRGNGRGGGGGGAAPPIAITATPALATGLLGKPVANAQPGDKGPSATITIKAKTELSPTRNVVGIIRGTDPVLRNQYIVIGAHSDHVGYARSATVEHDSLKAYNMIAVTEGAEASGRHTPTPEDWVRINAIKDSLRKIYPARMDSIYNGADDDGTGSVSILEIAEAFAKGTVKPKRSLIFIWQMGEEKGLWGSQYWTNHPTVPRDSVVADLNLDMVGRGEATDVTGEALDTAAFRIRKSQPPAAGGGRGRGLADGLDTIPLHGAPNYLQLVGAGRLSTELDRIANDVNKTQKVPFAFDYSMDADSHPQNIYCRSDHANYARYNIPVIFFTTGGHADYHQVTDEPEYIRYEHMARVDQLVFDIAVKVGNLDHRVVVDKTKFESPFSGCQQ